MQKQNQNQIQRKEQEQDKIVIKQHAEEKPASALIAQKKDSEASSSSSAVDVQKNSGVSAVDNNVYKALLEQLLPLLDEGVYIVDKDGRGLFYNQAMAAIERIKVEDVLGREYHKAFPGVKVSESTLFHALKKGVRSSGKRQTYRNLYGREITTVNSTVPVRSGGKIVAAVEVAKDITNLVSMSDTILELQDKEEHPRAEKPKIRRYTFEDLIGRDPDFLKVIEKARRAAENQATVFIYGETGTGKELFAQSIHYAGTRRSKPFLAQNCAAIPSALLEGILFGTSKGGFTGAVDRAGLFEQATRGTLLLDEINAMPYELQGKLLRVLQENYVRRVGGTKDIPIDTRIIATVNEPPAKLIESGRLRKDLFYRLNVINLTIPPLRDRKSDIPLLAESILARENERFGKEIWMISDAVLELFQEYDYPGNVRELENLIAQAVSMATKEHVLSEKLVQMPVRADLMGHDVEKWDHRRPLDDYLDNLEKELIREALLDAGGNISRAAANLKIKRQTLQHKLKKYGLKE